jgi:Tol biopolymer transport system component
MMRSAGSGDSGRRRLDSWKAIAQYLSRDVTTVRRWEKHEGLPVHRHLHAKLGSVHAFTDEIDEWWLKRTSPARDDLSAVGGARQFPTLPASSLVSLAVILVLTAGPGSRATGARAGLGETAARFALTPPPGVLVESLVIAPDGHRAAFSARGPDGTMLWIREFDSPVSTPLPGTQGVSYPFWSADGHQVGFFADARLKRISISTREIHDLAPAPVGLGGTWNAQGEIVFAPDRGAPLMRMSIATGQVQPITSLGAGFREGHAWPFFLPDGRHVLYTDYCADGRRYGIYVKDLDTGRTSRLVAAYSSAAYLTDGHLLYVGRTGSLVAHQLDLTRLEVKGEPVAIADRVLLLGDAAFHGDFSVSRDGIIAARTADDERNRLVWTDRSGKRLGTIGQMGSLGNPTLSSDGTKLAATVDNAGRSRIWVFDAAGGDGRPLTTGRIDYAPLWSNAADRLWFMSVGDRGPVMNERALDADHDSAMTSAPRALVLDSRSRDGRYATFGRIGAGTRYDVWAWRVPDQKVFPVLTGTANEGQSQLSPDGRWLAYASDESGRFEVYVRAFPESTWVRQVSTGGANDPRWRSDGRELFFIAADRKLMAAPIETEPAFQMDRPTSLFDTGIEALWQDTRNHYDVSSDGSRFVLLAPERDRRTAPFTVIVSRRRF